MMHERTRRLVRHATGLSLVGALIACGGSEGAPPDEPLQGTEVTEPTATATPVDAAARAPTVPKTDAGATCPIGAPYTREKSGSGSTGATVCCDAGDEVVSVVDCGQGRNHSALPQGECGVAREGPGNYGTACARVHCKRRCGPADAGPG
jgi:hypothetical protein